jgi:hypothetical protein
VRQTFHLCPGPFTILPIVGISCDQAADTSLVRPPTSSHKVVQPRVVAHDGCFIAREQRLRKERQKFEMQAPTALMGTPLQADMPAFRTLATASRESVHSAATAPAMLPAACRRLRRATAATMVGEKSSEGASTRWTTRDHLVRTRQSTLAQRTAWAMYLCPAQGLSSNGWMDE